MNKQQTKVVEDRLYGRNKIIWQGNGWYRLLYSVWKRVQFIDHDNDEPMTYIREADTKGFTSLG